MYNFKNILEKSSKSPKSLMKNLIYSESDAQPFYKMVKQYYNENPDASDEEIYKYFEDLFEEINLEFAKLPNMRNLTIECNTCEFLNKNEKERKEAFDKVIKEENEKGMEIYDEEKLIKYSSNPISAIRTLTMQGIYQLREYKQSFSKEAMEEIKLFLKLSKKEQSKQKSLLNASQRNMLQERIDYIKRYRI